METNLPLIRPMRREDVVAAERLSDDAFRALGSGHLGSGRTPAAARSWCRRTEHLLQTDPEGCWVAEGEGGLVGLATSLRRDLTWILSTYAVRPDRQGAGLGNALLQAALDHAGPCLRGMLAAGDDPRAFRRYHAVGFTLHPQLLLTGRVERTALPVVRHVREGTPGDRDMLDSLDRRCRDAAHGPDHELLAEEHRLVVVDHTTGQGYAYLDTRSGEVALLAASNRRTATRLMWEAIASAQEEADWTLTHVTSANAWAVDVAMAARLTARTSGYLALRGMKPPVPYLHHGTLL